jgi:hypothetical protein
MKDEDLVEALRERRLSALAVRAEAVMQAQAVREHREGQLKRLMEMALEAKYGKSNGNNNGEDG